MSTTVLPISGMEIEFMREIYVDDMDLLTLLDGMFKNDMALKIAQENLNK